MTDRLRIVVGQTEAKARLFEDLAPNTVRALLDRLPIHDRTIQTRWSGDAWRTEANYELLPPETPVENVAGHLSAGDIIYYPGYDSGLVKIGIAYGDAQWLAPFRVPIEVAHIGKVDVNLDGFVHECERIIFDGPLSVRIERIDAGT
jgi:hypothetical protein